MTTTPGADRVGTPANDNSVLKLQGGVDQRMWLGRWDVTQPDFQVSIYTVWAICCLTLTHHTLLIL